MVIIQIEPAHVDGTGTVFMVYAERYSKAAVGLLDTSKHDVGFDPVPYYLLCQSLELHLKSFIWLEDRIGTKTIKNRYGHDLEKLWTHAKTRRIDRYAQVTDLRNSVISLVAPYYRKRQFNYLDLEMVFDGYKNLKSEKKVIPTLKRLANQLGKSLKQPILKAS